MSPYTRELIAFTPTVSQCIPAKALIMPNEMNGQSKEKSTKLITEYMGGKNQSLKTPSSSLSRPELSQQQKKPNIQSNVTSNITETHSTEESDDTGTTCTS